MSEISAIDAVDTAGQLDLGTAETVENPGALLDRDAFLKLLVAQLKHQDPSSPADASQMLQQSAQLTMVDRLNEIAESMTAASAIDRLSLAGSMIGREITFLDERSTLTEAPVESVRFEEGEFVLLAGGFSVPIEAVLELRAGQDAPPATPTIPFATEPVVT